MTDNIVDLSKKRKEKAEKHSLGLILSGYEIALIENHIKNNEKLSSVVEKIGLTMDQSVRITAAASAFIGELDNSVESSYQLAGGYTDHIATVIIKALTNTLVKEIDTLGLMGGLSRKQFDTLKMRTMQQILEIKHIDDYDLTDL